MAVVAVLGADTSAREFGLGKGRQLVARIQHRASVTAPAVVAVDAPAAAAPVAAPAAAAPALAASAEAPPADAPPAPVAVASAPEPPAPAVVKKASRKSTRAGKPQPRPVARQVLSRL